MDFLRYHLPLIVYAGIIFWLSSLPNLSQPFTELSISDKLIHFFEFMVFGWLIWRSAKRWRLKLRNSWLVIITYIIGALYAAGDEYHQAFVPGRYGHISDWTADSIGLAAGIASSYFLTGRKENSRLNV
jgi:VanZ family protein